MKKSLVAAGILVALGLVWTGSAWYTGKQVEQNMTTGLQQANEQLQQTGLKITYQNYQRGVFSSHFQLAVTPVDGQENGLLTAGKSLLFEETIDHGPFPLASLKSLSLMPTMASVRTRLLNNETSAPLFVLTQNETPFIADTRITYGGNTQSAIQFKPLDFARDENKITFSGGQFQFNTERDFKSFSLAGKVANATISIMNKYGQKMRVSFADLGIDSITDTTASNTRIGSQNISLGQLSAGLQGQEQIHLEKVNLGASAALSSDGGSINSQLDYNFANLKVQGREMGSGKLTVKLNDLDAEAWRQFSQQYEAAAQTLHMIPEIDAQQYRRELQKTLARLLPVLLKGNPSLAISPLSWSNAKGEASFNLALLLQGPTPADATENTQARLANGSLKSLDGKLVIPVDMAVAFMTQVAEIEGYSPQEAAKFADQQVNSLAAMGQMFRLTTTNNNAITSSVQYADNQITINGRKMSLPEFSREYGSVLE